MRSLLRVVCTFLVVEVLFIFTLLTHARRSIYFTCYTEAKRMALKFIGIAILQSVIMGRFLKDVIEASRSNELLCGVAP